MIRIARPAFGAFVFSACALGAALASGSVPASARGEELPQLSASPIPTPTPIVNLLAPPLSVAAPDAAASCANDQFLAYRAVPMPIEREVTVCGRVIAIPAGAMRGGPTASFAVDADGTAAIPVLGALRANPGDNAVVHGRYHRDKTGAEWIDRITQAVAREWSLPGYVILNGVTNQ